MARSRKPDKPAKSAKADKPAKPPKPPRPRAVPTLTARPRTDVYVGMLGLALVATLIGCAVLALEMTEYDWATDAAKGPTFTAPVDAGPKKPDAAPKS